MIYSKQHKIILFLNTLFVSVFIYSSLGYLLLYYPSKIIIKEVVRNKIEANEFTSEELKILSFNIVEFKNKKYDFVWEKVNREFRFNGKMYDVERSEIQGDSIYFFCYDDEKENILNEIFTLLFNHNKYHKTQINFYSLTFVGLFNERDDRYYKYLFDQASSNIPIICVENGIVNHVSDVPTPPPRHS